MAYRSFEKLEVWQRSCRLSVRIYKILQNCKDFGLKDQMTRASVSIVSNIAEGAERDPRAEFARSLNIAKGSAAKLRAQFYIAYKINLVSDSIRQEILDELKTISRMLHKLINSIKVSLT